LKILESDESAAQDMEFVKQKFDSFDSKFIQKTQKIQLQMTAVPEMD
jgi:hypothetical protein